MKRTIILAAVLTLLAMPLFAHGTDSHTVMGTVKAVEGASLTVTTTEGKEVAVALTDETVYLRGAEKASRADLRPAMRVVVKLTHDNASAVSIRMPAKK